MNGNLTAWTRPNSTAQNSYQYDAVGNRANYIELWNGTQTAYNYQTGGNRLLNVQNSRGITRNYSYTADGALKAKVVDSSGTILTSETFGYNTAGLLWKYTAGTQDWRYRYSASGEREQKRNYAGTKTWTYYLLGGDKRQLAVYEGEESEVDPCNDNMLTPPPSRSVYLLPKEYLTYGGATHNLTTKPSGEKEYTIADHLGSTRVVLSSVGMDKTYDYEPFGGVIAQTGINSRLSFIDKEKDAENGLGDFGVRKYDDDLGRFLSVDPLWEKYNSLSPYNYCGNNPLNAFDKGGDSIIVLQDWQGASGMGHTAVLIGGDDSGWQLYSKNGGASGVFGTSSYQDGERFSTLEVFKENANENWLQGRYDNAVIIPTTIGQDQAAKKAAGEVVRSYYLLIGNSCPDVASKALEAAGKNPGTQTFIDGKTGEPSQAVASVPNNRYHDIVSQNRAQSVDKRVISPKRQDKKPEKKDKKKDEEQK